MSRSNPSPTSPVRRYLSWAGSKGYLIHYDKQAEEEIPVEPPFSFLVLDELTTIGGFSKANKSRIWSNEVRSVDDPLIIRTSAGTLLTGSYNQMKDKLKAEGGKYAKSVYIAYQEPSGEGFEWVIGNIKLVGAAMGSWFDFNKKHDVYRGGVRITGFTNEKEGTNEYMAPVFEIWQPSDADNEAAVDLDRTLQQYLDTYFKQKRDDAMVAEDKTDEPVIEDIDDDDKPIDLSEIPF